MRGWRQWLWGALFLSALSCDGAPPSPSASGSLVIANRSQYAITELREHPALDYLAAPNLLESSLEIEGEVVFYGSKLHYFTVFRERYRGGPSIALTTAEPVELRGGTGARLEIFDTSFRRSDASYLDPRSGSLPILGDP